MTLQEQITQLTADLAECRKWLKEANLKFDDSDFRVSELLKQIAALKESKRPWTPEHTKSVIDGQVQEIDRLTKLVQELRSVAREGKEL